MGFLTELERRLEHLFEGLFARLFRGGVPPSAVARAVEDALELREVDGAKRAVNVFTVKLHPADHRALAPRLEAVCRAAAERASRLAVRRGWELAGRPRVRIVPSEATLSGQVEVEVGCEVGPGELELVAVAGAGGIFRPRSSPVTIGREPDCDLVLDDADVSRRHATIEVRGDSYVVTDLGSTNGTAVNGQPVASLPLRDGDVVAFGPVHFQVRER